MVSFANIEPSHELAHGWSSIGTANGSTPWSFFVVPELAEVGGTAIGREEKDGRPTKDDTLRGARSSTGNISRLP